MSGGTHAKIANQSVFNGQSLENLAEQLPQNSVGFAAYLDGDDVPDLVVANFHYMVADQYHDGVTLNDDFQQFVTFQYAYGRATEDGSYDLGPLTNAYFNTADPYATAPDLYMTDEGLFVSPSFDLDGGGLAEITLVQFTPPIPELPMGPQPRGLGEGKSYGELGYYNRHSRHHQMTKAEAQIGAISARDRAVEQSDRGLDYNRDGVADAELNPPLRSPGVIDLTDLQMDMSDLQSDVTHLVTPLLVK